MKGPLQETHLFMSAGSTLAIYKRSGSSASESLIML